MVGKSIEIGDSLVNKHADHANDEPSELSSQQYAGTIEVDHLIKLIRLCRREGVAHLKTASFEATFFEGRGVSTARVMNSGPKGTIHTAEEEDWDTLMASDPVAFEARIKELG